MLIPWHVGSSFVCATTRSLDEESYHAIAAEAQANRFAANLLVPTLWLQAIVATKGAEQIKPLMDVIYNEAGVSAHVACLRLTSILPPGHAFALTTYPERVVLSGQAPGTRLDPPAPDSRLERLLLDRFATQVEELTYGSYKAIWWRFGEEPHAYDEQVEDDRSSREVLDELLDRHVPAERQLFTRQSVGGVVGAENDVARREGVTEPTALYGRFRARFAKRRDYPEGILEDPDFDRWLRKRAVELGHQ